MRDDGPLTMAEDNDPHGWNTAKAGWRKRGVRLLSSFPRTRESSRRSIRMPAVADMT